jgi:hypothetical protein
MRLFAPGLVVGPFPRQIQIIDLSPEYRPAKTSNELA